MNTRAVLVVVLAFISVGLITCLAPARFDAASVGPSRDASVAERSLGSNPRADTQRYLTPEPADGGAIETGDRHRLNGVTVDSTGRPLPGVQVTWGGGSGESDVVGRFDFPFSPLDQSADCKYLIASKAGYGTAQVADPTAVEQPLLVVIPPAAEIVGHVLGKSGPIPGAVVRLQDGAWARSVYTRDDGRFDFSEARTTATVLVVTAEGHVPRRVEVPPHIERRQVTVWLDESPDVPLRIVTADGAPVSGLRVTADWEWRAPELRVDGLSGTDGVAMRLPRLLLPTRVRVDGPGVSRRWYSVPAEADDAVTVPLDNPRSISIQTLGAGDRSGWWFAVGSNHSGEEWSPGSLRSAGAMAESASEGWVVSDKDGRAVLTGVSLGGAYSIVGVRRSRLGMEESDRFVVWATRSLEESLEPVEWVPPSLTKVEVATFAAAGAEGVAALVTFRPAPGSGATGSSDPTSGARGRVVVRTDASGRGYVLLAAGRYAVRAACGSVGSAEHILDVAGAMQRLDICIPRGVRVTGTLSSSASVLPGRQIVLTSDGSSPRAHKATSNASGEFVFESLPEGIYRAHFDGARGEKFVNGPIMVNVPGPPVSAVAALCTLRGCLIPAPTARMVVAVRPSGGRGVWIVAEPDASGEFEFSGISRCTWDLELRDLEDGWVRHSQSIDVEDGSFVRIELE